MIQRAGLWLALLGSLVGVPAGAQTASQGGIAIGGDVSNSTVTIGISPKSARQLVESATRDWKTLTDAQRKELGVLHEKLGVTEGALRAFFAVLGEKNVPEDQLPERLGEIARQHAQLQMQLRATPGDPTEVASLKAQARAALDAGKFDEADDLLARIGTLQDAALDAQRKERVQTALQRATLALSRLRYRDAAAQLAVAERYADTDSEKAAYRKARTDTLLDLAAEFDDAAAQTEAVGLLREAVARTTEAEPRPWMQARMRLVSGLIALGSDKAGKAQQDEAISLLNQVASSPFLARDPEFRAAFDFSYGSALCELGSARDDAKLQRQGAATLADIVKQGSSATTPNYASRAAINLAGCGTGNDVSRYDGAQMRGLRKEFVTQMEQAKTAAEWASAQLSAASIGLLIGQAEKSPDYLEDSAARLRAAMTIFTPESAYDSWKSSVSGLASALLQLQDLQLSVAPVEDLVEVMDDALARTTGQARGERITLELIRFRARVELSRATDDREGMSRALADLAASGASAADVEAESRDEFEKLRSEAAAFAARPMAPPAVSDTTTLALAQIGLDLTGKPAAEADKTLADFSEKLKANRRCTDAEAIAKAVGGRFVARDAVKVSDLPEPLRALATMKIGSASPIFGVEPKVSALILCGRRTAP